MSELKVIDLGNIRESIEKGESVYYEYYLKSEADKVIAELELKVARAQLILRLNKPEALYSNLETMSRLNHKIDVVERRERHQKYKRCLVMANYWGLVSACSHGEIQLKCMRRELKWRKLAEQLKEGI